MAEAIGTVAAVLQLAELAVKLRRLWIDIRQAPIDMLQLVDEVAILSDLLQDIRDPDVTKVPTIPSLSKSHHLIEKSIDLMSQLVTDTETLLRINSRKNAIVVWLKKDEVSKYVERLERCKSTMNLVLQVHSQAILRQQQSQLLDTIQQMMVSGQSQLTAKDSTLTTITNIGHSSDPHVHTGDITLTTNYRRHRRRLQTSSRTIYDLRLPSWLLRTGIRFIYERGQSSMGIHFRSYHEVPWQSEILNLALAADWDQVRELFQLGKASPYDVDPDGRTLLHYAARARDLEACKFLLSLGLDPSHKSACGMPLDMVSYDQIHLYPTEVEARNKFDEVFSLLAAAYPQAITIQDLRGFHLEDLTLNAIMALQREMLLPPESFSPMERAECLMSILWKRPEVLPVILGPNLDITTAMQLTLNSSYNHTFLLKDAARGLADCIFVPGHDVSTQLQWKNVVQAIVNFERSNHSSYVFESVYLEFIQCSFYHHFQAMYIDLEFLSDLLTDLGRPWLELLLTLDIDLERYGRAEKDAFPISDCRVLDVQTRNGKAAFHVKYMTTGPEVDDWRVYVVPCAWTISYTSIGEPGFTEVCGHDEYEMVGRFWECVEEPERFGMPGAYVEDEMGLEWVVPEILVQGPIF